VTSDFANQRIDRVLISAVVANRDINRCKGNPPFLSTTAALLGVSTNINQIGMPHNPCMNLFGTFFEPLSSHSSVVIPNPDKGKEEAPKE
jgi:hypothetical protein